MIAEFIDHVRNHLDFVLTSKDLFARLDHSMPEFKSEKYMKWFRSKHPGMDPHHLVTRRIDYLLVPLTRNQHTDGKESVEANKAVGFFFLLPISLSNLFTYIKEMESA